MRILSIGTDPRIFDPRSPSAARMASYGEIVERYDIIARAPAGQQDVILSPRVTVFAASSTSPAAFFFSAIRTWWRVRHTGPWDVVTAENPFEIGLAAWVIARLSGSALHLQVHGDFFGSRVWRHERPVNRLRLAVARFLAYRADGMRVVSERIRTSLEALGISEHRITVAPIIGDYQKLGDACRHVQGTRAHARYSNAAGIADVSLRSILYVGRLETEKNPLLLIDAFAAVRRRVSDARLTIVGSGSLEDAVRDRIRQHGLDPYVTLTPWTDALAEQYAAATLVAIPSNHEGWGRVAAEAGACDRAVVMTDVGCARELVIDRLSGWVVPVGDAQRMAEALVDALTHPEELARRAAALRRNVDALTPYGPATLRASWERAHAVRDRYTRPALRATVALLAVAVFARFAAYLLFVHRFGTGGEFGWYVLGSDDLGYLQLGQNLWHGVFSQTPLPAIMPEFLRTPGYPIFLMLLRFISGAGIMALQGLLAIFGVYLWYRLARSILPGRAAWWSAVLFALDPVALFWTTQFQTEALFSVFWFGSLLVFVTLIRRPTFLRAFGTGLLLGAAYLVRPIVLLYPVVLIATLVMFSRAGRRRLLAAVAGVLLGTALLIAPWAARNVRVFGSPLLTVKGVGLQFGEDVPTYLMWKHHISRAEAYTLLASRLPPQPLVLPRDTIVLGRVVRDVIREDPIGYAWVTTQNLIPFLFGDGWSAIAGTFVADYRAPIVRWNGNVIGYAHDALRIVWRDESRASLVFFFGKVWTLLTVLLATIGLIALLRNRRARPLVVWSILTILYFGLLGGTVAYSRYRFPVQPILYLLAVYGMRTKRTIYK